MPQLREEVILIASVNATLKSIIIETDFVPHCTIAYCTEQLTNIFLFVTWLKLSRESISKRAILYRCLEQELKAIVKSWSELEKLAKNRGKWRTLVRDLCPSLR